MDCEVIESVVIGDHTVFFGKILRAFVHPDDLKPKAIYEESLHVVGNSFF